MVMVNQPALRRHHRSRIAYAFGLLALLGAMATLLVLVHDPAMSSTRLATPVPAPEITVVDADPPTDDGPSVREEPDWLGVDDPSSHAGVTDPSGPVAGRGAGGQSDGRQELTEAAPAGHPATDVRRSLFWSGIFGLAISLAGLGLVGTRRRRW
ncbi:hypothetical protein C7C45_07600 [Micromonospora arborensis]|uniref:Uncharacterized protein n=1 Tax=Micromonospora arborensis TaxID=2116518 RepID=A0A318NS17_9ACTN|nr:hypothetical protein [Micromonospora arborensis]PYC73508.1 hypothetical protein C7C45_07600 [Micromonospora arborensis]